MKRPAYILPVIVFAQFAGTSIWFAGNAILPEIILEFGLRPADVGSLTSAVQLGFIAGTLVFAFLALADRFSPRLVFLLAALGGALLNALVIVVGNLQLLLVLRFGTGIMLAGIYPVGMKIAAGWHRGSLGLALGYLVGALVLGTAFPWLLTGLDIELEWRLVMVTVSLLALSGGIILAVLVPDGPYLKKGHRFDPGCMLSLFKRPAFRTAAVGYFGHMWELYAFWAFLPMLLSHILNPELSEQAIALRAFMIIAIGAPGCVAAGYLARRFGSHLVARVLLTLSGILALLSPTLLVLPDILAIAYLLIWGLSVVADSPLFSTLTASATPADRVGTGLTIVTSLGFMITVFSIQMIAYWLSLNTTILPLLSVLALGPIIGVVQLTRADRVSATTETAEIPVC